MSDIHSQALQPEQPPVAAGTRTAETPPATPVNNSNRNVFIIIGALVGVILVCICSISACGGIVGLFGIGTAKIITEQPKVESVIDQYMGAMAGKDAGKAYKLLSTRAKRNVSFADIEKFLEGNSYIVFEGYQSIALANFNLNLTSDADPTMPQGLVAEVDGMISYAGGFTGDFTAVLEQDGEEWRLFSINVNAPADKFGQ